MSKIKLIDIENKKYEIDTNEIKEIVPAINLNSHGPGKHSSNFMRIVTNDLNKVFYSYKNGPLYQIFLDIMKDNRRNE